jgi:hypothetical protein
MVSKRAGIDKDAIVASDPDALERYVPDLQNWPASWRFKEEDISFGQALVKVFRPFLQHPLTHGYARKILFRHRDQLWMLRAHLVEVRHVDPDSAAMDTRTLVLNQIHEFGGAFQAPF